MAPTTLTKDFTLPLNNALIVALDEPDSSVNVWLVTIFAKIGATYQRVGPQFNTIAPSLSGQGGKRLLARSSIEGVTEWRVTAVTPAAAQPGTLEVSGGNQLLAIPPALEIVEGLPVPTPPPPGVGAPNVAYVATPANGGDDGTAQLGNPSKSYATINTAINALLAFLQANPGNAPGVVKVDAGFYGQGIFVPAGAPANRLTLEADGIVECTPPGGPAFHLQAGSQADASAMAVFQMKGPWVLNNVGGQALLIDGVSFPGGGQQMGAGGLLFEGVTCAAGSIDANFVNNLVLSSVVQPNPGELNTWNEVSNAILRGETNIGQIEQTQDPTISRDFGNKGGIILQPGCSIRAITQHGAAKLTVKQGARCALVDGTNWAEFFAPGIDEAPALNIEGECTGDLITPIPAESAGAQHTVINLTRASWPDASKTWSLSKLAGATQVYVPARNAALRGAINASGLVDLDLQGSTYNKVALTVAGAAAVDEDEKTVAYTTTGAPDTILWPIPWPSYLGGLYTVLVTPTGATSLVATDPKISGKTPTQFAVDTLLAAQTLSFVASRGV